MSKKNNVRKYAVSTLAAAAAVATVAPVVSSAETQGFPDVKEGNDHYDAIMELTENGTIQGYQDGTFRPYDSISRGQIAAMLKNELDLKVPSDLAGALEDYNDVDATHGYAEEIAAVTQAGIFKGNLQGNFSAYDPIDRQQMATVLVEGFGLNDYEAEKRDVKLSNVSPSHRDNVQKIADLGITLPQGTANEFNPKEEVMRGQFATFLKLTTEVTAAEIVALENPAAITVDKGEGVDLPETVKATYDNDVTEDVDVKWDTSKFDDNKVGEYTLTGTVEGTDKTVEQKVTVRAVDVVVEDVSAINATEVKVTFSQQVLKSTVEDADIELDGKTPSEQEDVTPSDIQLQEDGKTAILRFANNELVEGTTYDMTIEEGILSTDYQSLGKYEGSFEFADTTPPSLEEVQVVDGEDGDKNLELTFDEEVNVNTGTLKVDGHEVDITGADNSGEAGDYTYVVAGANEAALKEGKHTAKIVGLEDSAENKAGTLTKSYTVSADTTPPKVTDIEAVDAVDGNEFDVTFSERLADGLGKTNFKVMKGNTEYTVDSVTLREDNTYRVIVDTRDGEDEVNPLYAKGENSVNLDVEVSNFQDRVGLYGEVYNGTVTLEKDTTAPKVLSENLNKIDMAEDNEHSIIRIPFNKNVDLVEDASGTVTVTDDEGVEYEVNPYAVTQDSPNENTSTFVGTVVDFDGDEGTYTVHFDADVVDDTSGNKNKALNTTAKFETETEYFTPASVTAVNNVITVNYNEAMTKSALNSANYKLDNEALPAGSKLVFNSAKNQVKITLPSDYEIPATANYDLEITQDVVAESGNVVGDDSGEETVNYVSEVGLTDNVAPELESAVYALDAKGDTETSYIQLTFSEDLAEIDGELDDNLTLSIGNNESVGTIANSIVDDNKLLIKVTDSDALNINQSGTIKLDVDDSGDMVIMDVATNEANPNTVNVKDAEVVNNIPE